ncbi:hypothetical protein ACF0H5_020578 [Mactra antiquata]
MEVRKAIKDYMDYATIHGIGRSKNSPFIVLRILWIVLLCGCLGMICLQVYELHKKYQSGPIITSVDIKSEQQLTFPTLLICNKNPVSYSKLPVDSDLYLLIQEAASKYSVDMSVYNGTSDIYKQDFSKFDKNAGNNPVENDVLRDTQEKFRMLMSILDDESLNSVSPKLDDLIILCNFLGQPCSRPMFRQMRTYEHGNCHIFDPTKDSRLTDAKTSVTGSDYSFEFMVYIDQENSIPFVTSSAGIVITAGRTKDKSGDKRGSDVAFDIESNVYVPTGFEANIGYQHVLFDRVPGYDTNKRCDEDLNSDGLMTVNFISDIGGQLGLWAGFSILSLLELLELIAILLFGMKKRRQSDNVVNVTE